MGYPGKSWLNSATGWHGAGLGLGLCLALLATPAVAEWRIEAIIAGVSDPNNAFIGDSFGGRCRVVDDTGTERTFLEDGTAVSELSLAMSLERGEPAGVEVTFSDGAVSGELKKAGLYVFRCRPGDEALAQGLQNRPGVIVARSPRIEAASIYLSLDDGVPGTHFEIGDVIRLNAFAYRDSKKQNPLEPVNIQVLLRRGALGCGGQGPLAFDDFRSRGSADWTPEAGSVRLWEARRRATYTVIVNQADGSGPTTCTALSFTVQEDAHEPLVQITTPAERQIRLSRLTMRISGTIRETGSGIDRVLVSNGNWTEEVRLFDTNRPGEFRFFSDLPYEPGLSLITVEARDRSGRVGRAARGVYAGHRYRPFGKDDRTFQGNREIRLRIGRRLLFDTQGAVDSLHEVVSAIPRLIRLGDPLPAAFVDEPLDQSVFQDVRNFFKPDLQATGAIVPGAFEFLVLPRDRALDFEVRVPITGRIKMVCEGFVLGWERALCALAGEPDGEFQVRIGGSVSIVIPITPTPIGGLSLAVDLEQVRVVSRLAISNGLDSAKINNGFRDRIVEKVESALDEFLRETFGCPKADEPRRDCRPERPFYVDFETPPGNPRNVGVLLNEGEREYQGSTSLPRPVGDGEFKVFLATLIDRFEMRNGRLQLFLSPNLRTLKNTPPTGLGSLLDLGWLTEEGTRPGEVDLLRLYGSGNSDLDGAIHLNFINEVLGEIWAAGLLAYEEDLFQVLDGSGFFADASAAAQLKAAVALQGARLKVDLLAPPRLTAYSAAGGLFLEAGAVRIEFDLMTGYDSRLVFEAGLIAEVSLSANANGNSLVLGLSNPTACRPNGVVFLNCRGQYLFGLVERKGLHEWTRRPDLVDGDGIGEFLQALGILDGQGRYRSRSQLENHYRGVLTPIVVGLLKRYEVALPEVPAPEFTLGAFELRPLKFRGLKIHDRARGGRRSRGWIAFEVNLRAD